MKDKLHFKALFKSTAKVCDVKAQKVHFVRTLSLEVDAEVEAQDKRGSFG